MKQYIMHVLGSVSQELYFPDAHLTDIIEILILTYLIYHIAMWLINTKAYFRIICCLCHESEDSDCCR